MPQQDNSIKFVPYLNRILQNCNQPTEKHVTLKHCLLRLSPKFLYKHFQACFKRHSEGGKLSFEPFHPSLTLNYNAC